MLTPLASQHVADAALNGKFSEFKIEILKFDVPYLGISTILPVATLIASLRRLHVLKLFELRPSAILLPWCKIP
jgi:hypothetical protein